MNGRPPGGGFGFALGPCYCCGSAFSYHPDLVAAVYIDPANGLPPDQGGDLDRARREPVCPSCARLANPFRRANGLEPIDERDSLEVARRGGLPPLL